MSKRTFNEDIDKHSEKIVQCNWLELQQVSNQCLTGLLHCQVCKSKPHAYSYHPGLFWALQLHCNTCLSKFTVCTLCQSNKSQFYNARDLKKHQQLKSHRRRIILFNEMSTCKTAGSLKTEINFEAEGDFCSTNIPLIPQVLCESSKTFLKENKLNYFLEPSKEEDRLFSSTYFANKNDAVEKVLPSDSKISLLVGNFTFKLSNPMREIFAELLSKIQPYMLPSYTGPTIPYALRLPYKTKTLRNTYYDGKHSLKEMIPVPPVTTIVHNSNSSQNIHTYSSLLDCLKVFFAFGKGIKRLGPIETLQSTSISELDQCQRVVENSRNAFDLLVENGEKTAQPFETIVTSFTVFSDDFDPTVSLVKANKNGIWVLQVTFLIDKPDHHEFNNTYVISLAPKGSDHSVVLRSFEEDINMLRSGRCPLIYHGGLQKMVKPILFPTIRHGDQPERRLLYGLKLGKGSSHARWRYSLNYNKVGHHLPSCKSCADLIIAQLRNRNGSLQYNEKICANCTNWEFCNGSPPIEMGS